VGAILLAEIGDIAWYTQFSQLRKLAGLDIVRVQSGQFAGQARISKSGRGLLRWALYHAAIGLARTGAGRTRLAALKAKRRGDRFAGFKAIVELAAKQLRVIWVGVAERAPVRPAARGRALPPGLLTGGARPPAPASPGSWQREHRQRGGSAAADTAGGPWRAAPALRSPDSAGWIPHGSAAIGWHHYDGA